MATSQWQKTLEIPGRVLFSEGNGDLARLEINTAWSSAELYLHGAHLTNFQRKDEPPILFMSQLSQFKDGTPIRGGIPIIFPWFGPREGHQAHGYARNHEWELKEVTQSPSGSVHLRLALPAVSDAAEFPKHSVNYIITVGKTLAAELAVANHSQRDFTFENCLHTYFAVSGIDAVSITGLKGAHYEDKTENLARKTEQAEAIKITAETDRTYLDAVTTVEILDTVWKRRIKIEKSGSNSTVVWNPWIEKSVKMPDFGDDEYKGMVCVESGNVSANRITLPAGQSASLKVEISSQPM